MSQENEAADSESAAERLGLEKEKHVRQRWWHEDHLVNQRTTWLLTTQGVLGAAYGYVQNRIAEINAGIVDISTDKIEPYLHALAQFSRGLLFIGFLSGLFLTIGIHAACIAQRNLQKQHPDVPLGVTESTTQWGQWTARATPILCCVAWVFAFVVGRN